MINSLFVAGVIRNGRLTEARHRFEAGTASPNGWTLESQSCWSLICEEVIDTEHQPEGYDAVYAELIRRGYTAAEIDEMRRIAWRTAGWLNYDMMLWDWVQLDEHDMRKALAWQLNKRNITKTKHEDQLAKIRQFLDRDLSRL